MMRSLATAVALAVAFTSTAAAQNVETVATYRDWNVLKLVSGGDTVCFAVSEPKDKLPQNVNHGDIFVMVSTWGSGVAANQPSFKAGFNLRPRSAPTIRIGSDRFEMYTSENEAFVEQPGEEQRLVSAMQRGSDMVVQATSARGTAVTYEFSLLGVTAALERVAKECEEA